MPQLATACHMALIIPHTMPPKVVTSGSPILLYHALPSHYKMVASKKIPRTEAFQTAMFVEAVQNIDLKESCAHIVGTVQPE